MPTNLRRENQIWQTAKEKGPIFDLYSPIPQRDIQHGPEDKELNGHFSTSFVSGEFQNVKSAAS